MFSMVNLKSILGDAKSRIQVLESEAAALKKKRQGLVSAPLPLDDFVDFVCSQIDVTGARWPDRVRGMFCNTHLRDYMETRGDGYNETSTFEQLYSSATGLNFPILRHPGDQGVIGLDALCWLFGGEMKKGIRSAMIDGLKDKWPKNTGTPREKRLADLREIDAKIFAVESDLDRIRSELAEIKSAAN